MIRYFISYSHIADKRVVLFGNVDTWVDGPIRSGEDIKALGTQIEDDNDLKNVVILSWQRFEDEPVTNADALRLVREYRSADDMTNSERWDNLENAFHCLSARDERSAGDKS